MKDKLQKYLQRINELEKENSFLREKLDLQNTPSRQEEKDSGIAKSKSENNLDTESLSDIEDKKVQLEIIKFRKQVEMNEDLLRKIIDISPFHVVSLDCEGKYIIANKSYCESFEKSFEEIRGTHYSKVLPEKLAARHRPFIERALSGETVEFEDTNPPGSQVPEHAYGIYTPIKSTDGEIQGCVVYVVDITDRKKAEKLLFESEERFKAFMNYFPGATFIKNKNHQLLYCNEHFAQMLQTTSEKIIGTDISLNVSPETEKIYEQENKEVIENGKSLKAESVFAYKGENTHWLTYKFPVKIETEILLGAISIDITEGKKAEERLRESERNFKTLFSFYPDLVNIIRISDRKIVAVNDNFARQFDMKVEDITGKTLNYLDVWLDPEILDELLKEIIKEGGNNNFETRLRRKDGSIFSGLISSKVFEFNGEPHILSVTRDISELKEKESVINKQNEELKKLNSDKDRFISILAHDLKGPFSSILALLNLLTLNIRKYDIDKIEKQIKLINKSANNTFNLLEEILIWIRTNSGKIPFEPQELILTDICNGVFERLKLTADNKKIKFRNFIKPEISVFADRSMLVTIIRNLVSNAIKFTNESGEIIINAETDDRNVIITVRDNGIGIEAHRLDNLFDVMQELSTEGTSHEKGTGLGLFLCKEFVELHEGKIWVESKPGKGSDFKFTLPISTDFHE